MSEPIFKALLQGDPATGKTGSMASLLDGGYRVILCDFDGNPEALRFNTAHPERLFVVPFGDELVAKDSGVERAGSVSSVRAFTKFLYSGNDELGKPKEWGRDTVLALDSISSLCDNAMRLALSLNRGVTRDGAHIGVLCDEVEVALSLFCSTKQFFCHRIAISHLKLISPRPESSYSGETDLQKQVKREVAALEETAYFPNIPGRGTARSIARMFNTALLYELSDKDELQIRTKPIKGYTIKVPVPVADKLPIETGLLTIMQAFGAAMKGVAA